MHYNIIENFGELLLNDEPKASRDRLSDSVAAILDLCTILNQLLDIQF